MNPDQTPPTLKFLTVTDEKSGQRIDNFLVTQLKGLPKSRLYRALRQGEVRVNKKRVKAEYRLQSGDLIRIPPVRLSSPKESVKASVDFLQFIENTIIFENKDFILINKPSGLASHGGSGISFGAIEGFRQLRPKAKFLELAHRLDRETTGCMILAKKSSVLRELHEGFLKGSIKKTYLALLAGRWIGGACLVDQPLLKNTLSSGERIVRIDEAGKAAQTRFKPLKISNALTLVALTPLTGRTHQIRVHSAHLGFPILGDKKYDHLASELSEKHINSVEITPKHLMLHAASIEFKLFDEKFAFCACLDAEFQRVLRGLDSK